MIRFISYKAEKQEKDYFNKLMNLVSDVNISIISDKLPLIGNLSVVENIMLPISYHKNVSLGTLENKVVDILKQYNMENILYYRKNQLSIYEDFIVKFITAKLYEAKYIVFLSSLKYLHGKDKANFLDLLACEGNEKFVIIEYYEFYDMIVNKLNISEDSFDQWVIRDLKA